MVTDGSTSEPLNSDINRYIGIECEREYLSFDVLTEGLSEEVSNLVFQIKEVAQSVLFHWQKFPIVLPPPLAVHHEPPSITCIRADSQNEILDQRSCDFVQLQRDAPLFGKVQPLVLRDVFVSPSFDELEAIAIDSKGDFLKLTNNHRSSMREKGLHQDTQGKRRRLNEYQLKMLKNNGEFEVQSLHFPGKTHKWKVSEFLQKGSEQIHETFLNDLAMAASLFIITGKYRLTGNIFSLKHALDAIWEGTLTLLDLVVGIQWVQSHNLESRMKEERCSYLVQELTAKDGDVEGLCSWILQQVKRATREKFRFCGSNKQPYVPYLFETPQGLNLNLKLFNREIMRKMLPILVGILEKESRGWFLHFREKIISQLKSRSLSEMEVEKEGNKLVQGEYLSRVYSSIYSNSSLKSFGEDIPNLLVEQAKAVNFMHQAISEVERIYEEGEDNSNQELMHTNPILSRIDVWLQDKLSVTRDSLVEQHKWRPHEHALALCRKEGLHQHAYFLQRDLSFMKEREPVLLNELQNVKVALRTFEWRAQIWFPGNYIVRRSFQGENEVIPTVLALAPTSITTPRSDPSQPVYFLEKQIIHVTSTRWPFWRWFNFLYRSWSWTCNILFFFAVWLPLCSPVGLRVLFSQDPFMVDFELSQVNGTVCPCKTSLTPTLYSRLINLWRHISKSRTHFETMPDTGFIGKGVSRHINRLWNYLVKGVLLTFFLTAIFPMASIVISIGSFAIAVTSPLWCPVCVVGVHIFFILVYDYDSPNGTNKWFPLLRVTVCNFFFLGFLQPIFAVAFAFFISPILALIVVLYGFARRSFHHIWDNFMFHVIIKKRGRIPASNSILVKRIAGPGLEDSFVYQISVEQALAAFEARLEMDELTVFEKEMEELISEPLIVYGKFVQRCFGPFSCVLGRFGNFGRVEKEVRDLNQTLSENVEKRRHELALGLPLSIRAKVKMNTLDLKLALKQSICLLEQFYPSKIFSKVIKNSSENFSSASISSTRSRNSELLEEINTLLGQELMEKILPSPGTALKKFPQMEVFESIEAWWDARGLPVGDYAGLCSLMFTEIFSAEFLTPLEENDTIFQMEVQGVSLSRYTEMIRSMPERKDLDEKLTVHTPRGNIQIHTPYLDLSSFTPLVRHSVPTHKTEKASLAARLSLRLNPGKRLAEALRVPEKLLIPPPVPHPAQIAVIIHNRDASEPILLEEGITKQILRMIEDSTHAVSTANQGDFPSSSESGNVSSVYDDHLLLSQQRDPQTFSQEQRRRSGTGQSRTATLEMTKTLEERKSIDSESIKRSTTLESIPQRSSGWLSSPLRTLLEGQMPFSVALNLASAEDENSATEEEENCLPPLPLESRYTHSIPPNDSSTHTTAV